MFIPLSVAVTVIVLFRCVFLLGYVPTSSMEPTLKTGSVFLGFRIIGSIEVGDIIVFRHDERLLVKRVAAVSGDMIEHNGQVLSVPEDSFYVLGDNCRSSYDSRYWEYPFVKSGDIVAKVFLGHDTEVSSICAVSTAAIRRVWFISFYSLILPYAFFPNLVSPYLIFFNIYFSFHDFQCTRSAL